MEAPDKIYIPLYPNYNLDGFHLADEWMYEPHKECDNVTYILKEALLEWAKECKSDVADDVSHGDAFACGYNCGMNELIEKINSL